VSERLRIGPSFLRAEGAIPLPREAIHHLRVARVPWGTEVVLFDGEGFEREGTLDPGGDTVTLRGPVRAGVGADRACVTWLQGYPKGDKLDTILRQATELGVAAFWPVYTARSVPHARSERQAARLARWRRIAEEAARQSGRADLPELHPPEALDVVLDALPEGALRLLAWEGASTPLARVVAASTRRPVVVLVGPEGGLDANEVACCVARGFVAVSLGPRILRTETVAPAMLTALSVLCGDLAP
jgi:16S rRNA (uracil1498-N3)-methyltransferase